MRSGMVPRAATGLIVANLYYCQPLLVLIAHDLHVPLAAVTWLPPVTEMGYAAGLSLLVPLGDRMERRRLMVMFTGLLTLCVGLWRHRRCRCRSPPASRSVSAAWRFRSRCRMRPRWRPRSAARRDCGYGDECPSGRAVALPYRQRRDGGALWMAQHLRRPAVLMLLLSLSLRLVLKPQHPPSAALRAVAALDGAAAAHRTGAAAPRRGRCRRLCRLLRFLEHARPLHGGAGLSRYQRDRGRDGPLRRGRRARGTAPGQAGPA